MGEVRQLLERLPDQTPLAAVNGRGEAYVVHSVLEPRGGEDPIVWLVLRTGRELQSEG